MRAQPVGHARQGPRRPRPRPGDLPAHRAGHRRRPRQVDGRGPPALRRNRPPRADPRGHLAAPRGARRVARGAGRAIKQVLRINPANEKARATLIDREAARADAPEARERRDRSRPVRECGRGAAPQPAARRHLRGRLVADGADCGGRRRAPERRRSTRRLRAGVLPRRRPPPLPRARRPARRADAVAPVEFEAARRRVAHRPGQGAAAPVALRGAGGLRGRRGGDAGRSRPGRCRLPEAAGRRRTLPAVAEAVPVVDAALPAAGRARPADAAPEAAEPAGRDRSVDQRRRRARRGVTGPARSARRCGRRPRTSARPAAA